MGVVRFAIGFPHTFCVVAAPILFLGMTAGIKMPAEILHTRDLAMKGVQFLKIAFVRYGRETGQTFSTQERAALEWAETLTLISETHAPEEIYRDIAAHFNGKGNGRSHDRDRPDERLQPHRHRIRARSRLLMTCDPLRSKQEISHDCDEKRDRQPRRRGSAR
jgi:hypothetical protein